MALDPDGSSVATADECRQALDVLAARLAAAGGRSGFDRSLSCTISDLGLAFAGQLADGQLVGIAPTDAAAAAAAQVRLTMTSDDLVALVGGTLKAGPAWASGRLRIDAAVRDLMRLRALL